MIYLAFGIPIILAFVATVALVLPGVCAHAPVPEVDPVTGKTFLHCRCGKRFEP